MKILIITGIYPPDIGGPATYSKLLNDKLPERNIKTDVLSFGEVRYLPKIFRHIFFIFKIISKSKGVDLFYAQDPVSVGLPTLIVSKILGKKYIIRVAGDYAWEQGCQRFNVKDNIDEFQKKQYCFAVSFFKKIQSIVVKNSRLTITPSYYFRDLVSGWINSPNKVITIYNGIKLDENKISIEEAEEKLNIKKEGKIILSAGRLVPWKGFDTLIDVLKKLNETGKWSLIIVGDGPDMEKLKEKAKTCGLEDKIIFAGSVDKERMIMYYKISDIFVLNTSFESFSFQIVESMNAGVPVVSTKVGNLSEIISSGLEGYLVEYNNKKELFEAIVKISNDENLKRKIIKNARKKAENFSIENTINNLVNVINNL